MYFDPLMAADKVLKGTEEMDGGQITAMTIVGLLVVFSALLILVLFLYGSGSVFKRAAGKPQKKTAPKQAQPPKKTAAPAAPKAPAKAPAAAAAPASAGEDEEVIAVIMAAISAMGEAEGKTYQLKSVKPVSDGAANPRRAWSQAGLISQTRPF
ncbi:MAG: OadG family protein [Oscillospiraceae bacterium]|nr:OadG family protein [Oscillospiraceae bacterium]